MTNITQEVVDLLSPEFFADPYSFYSRLRQELPLCQLSDGTYVLSRYDDVKFVLRRNDIFSSGWSQSAMVRPSWLREDLQRDPFITEVDPPELEKQKRLIQKFFLEREVKRLHALMKSTATSLLDSCKSKGLFDFLADFAYPYAVAISDQMSGLELASRIDKARDWVELTESIPTECPHMQQKLALEERLQDQNNYYDSLAESRRENPKNDLVTKLINARLGGEPLSKARLRGALHLLMMAGFEAPAQALACAFVILVHEPDIANLLRNDREKIAAFTEELLRMYGPAHGSFRVAKEKVLTSGGYIPANASVLALIGAANRDPSQFDNPDTFNLHRPNLKSHLAFGQGVHICTGEALARSEVIVAVETLLDIQGGIECPTLKELVWGSVLAGLYIRDLPARFT